MAIGTHPKSEMPLTREYRLFFYNHQLVWQAEYWETSSYAEAGIDETTLSKFLTLAQTVPSQFFTMDIAKTVDGRWLIVELGDGQVSGLPDVVDREAFYAQLKELSQD